MATDSQGNTFVFAGSTYTVTNVQVTPGGDLLDQSHLGQASGAGKLYQAPALMDDEVSADYLGTNRLVIGTTGNLSFASVTYTAIVSSSGLTYAVGDLVKGNATFKVRTS